MQIIGIISDTHLSRITPQFVKQARTIFSPCTYIVHAGDLTEAGILDIFSDKQVIAVHGNMCSAATKQLLPESTTFQVNHQTIAVYHGHGGGLDIEDYLLTHFATADAIIFGHTHRPLVSRAGRTLLVNPGTFRLTGRYGSPGTYALMTSSATGLTAAIHQLPLSR
ncbi:metallophosphoesterase family protein [Desulfofustis limnaeus]|jgi:putative phosphoesterase|uniref:Phosphoesterase n=1 Tax=Desulfofustis limnaeus TaxID=2740163 RepID=A0ABN6LYT3_9BACT|nr:metallophosphoesterase [Desulfofustis limnaeus]MDX9893846.1 metallophosphoesterase [Desulfofustis sp.]BDD85796.1 phosphodiesterase [Desulfofustis limnaeus]